MPLVGQRISTTRDNFADMVRNNYLLVDKSLMIKDFIESPDNATLLVRPRRFGKTLNLSMLEHFFAAKVSGQSTTGLFDQFAIAKVDGGKFLQQHQGQYPVIFLSLKDIHPFLSSSEMTLPQAERGGIACDRVMLNIKGLMQKLYRKHIELFDSGKLDLFYEEKFKEYVNGTINTEGLKDSIAFLSECMHKAHNKKVIILIDEYDSPLTKAYEQGSLDALSEFFRDMFSAALKTNEHLDRGLMAGILRVSKNTMLSGLNNLKTYTILDKAYESYFGFTEDEISELMITTQVTHSLTEIRNYYNGYRINNTVLYNPWSVMQFFDTKELGPYWVWTSNDKLLRDILLNSDNETKTCLTHLMQGKIISKNIDINLRYEELITSTHALWTLLLFTGYLTIESKQRNWDYFSCQLKIPNAEVLSQYTRVFSDWLKDEMGHHHYHVFLENLIAGNVTAFTLELSNYLMQSLSFRDVSGDKKSERFYHGFIAGLIASLTTTHYLDSNKESGLGLYDFMLVPKSTTNSLSIILEFKHAKTDQPMKAVAELALQQIDTMQYTSALKKYSHINKVLKIGLAFCEKAVIAAFREEDLLTHINGIINFSQEYTSHE